LWKNETKLIDISQKQKRHVREIVTKQWVARNASAKKGWVLWYGEENNPIRSPCLSIKKGDDENCWNQNELIFVVNNKQ
jgi:hypothetical protein